MRENGKTDANGGRNNKPPTGPLTRDDHLRRTLSLRRSKRRFTWKREAIPGAKAHEGPEKCGWLTKQCGKGLLASWKRRYCVLKRPFFFYYEKEDSDGSEKSAGGFDLGDYDRCEEGTKKDCRKSPNSIVVVPSSTAGNDVLKMLFFADSKEERDAWIKAINSAIEKAKHPIVIDSEYEDDGTPTRPLEHVTKERPKPRGRRPPTRQALREEAKFVNSPSHDPRFRMLTVGMKGFERNKEETESEGECSVLSTESPRPSEIKRQVRQQTSPLVDHSYTSKTSRSASPASLPSTPASPASTRSESQTPDDSKSDKAVQTTRDIGVQTRETRMRDDCRSRSSESGAGDRVTNNHVCNSTESVDSLSATGTDSDGDVVVGRIREPRRGSIGSGRMRDASPSIRNGSPGSSPTRTVSEISKSMKAAKELLQNAEKANEAAGHAMKEASKMRREVQMFAEETRKVREELEKTTESAEASKGSPLGSPEKSADPAELQKKMEEKYDELSKITEEAKTMRDRAKDALLAAERAKETLDNAEKARQEYMKLSEDCKELIAKMTIAESKKGKDPKEKSPEKKKK
uniref:PH domain-containing protein n=1 Tax=Branchiostoma floridae TaxID=7739 RepID=C3Y1S3_BRAFL|eukprot:XP_002609803.1 hypothetical protein BRAFLDRAFT_78634 [Branchiostoma floridae]